MIQNLPQRHIPMPFLNTNSRISVQVHLTSKLVYTIGLLYQSGCIVTLLDVFSTLFLHVWQAPLQSQEHDPFLFGPEPALNQNGRSNLQNVLASHQIHAKRFLNRECRLKLARINPPIHCLKRDGSFS